MNLMMIAGAMLAATIASSPEHVVRLDHRAGAVEARYRGAVTIAFRQIGAGAPPGAPATLRCAWTAKLAVSREAAVGNGLSASRAFAPVRAFEGVRPGWCAANRQAIATEVAARDGTVLERLRGIAAADREPLVAELDRLHSGRSAG
jgi:hypothetical protein